MKRGFSRSREEKAESLPLGWIDPVQCLRHARPDSQVGGGHAEKNRILILFERERGNEGIRQRV